MQQLIDFGPLLEVLVKNIDILPACGGAIELLEQPDEQKKFEETIGDKEDHIINAFAETEKPNFLYKKLLPIQRTQDHFFRYFIDGTVQTYVLGTGLEHDRTFPIVMAQIGAAALKRENDGSLHQRFTRTALMLLIPFNMLSESLIKLVFQSVDQSKCNIQIIDTTEKDDDLGGVDESTDLTNRATGIAKGKMRAIERELAYKTAESSDGWLIIDGTIRSGSYSWGQGVPKTTVAVAKSFSEKPVFNVFKEDREIRNLPRLLANLGSESRTPAFFTSKGKVAFWYLRLREQGQVDYPLMGVIKIEIPTPKPNEHVATNVIDHISSCLLGERTVSPYGLDTRWHAHLYPIYSTEQYIKSQLFSREILKGMIKWPQRS
jgi:hypothetical protein